MRLYKKVRKIKKIVYPPLRREWFRCKKCGAKLAIYDNTAALSGGIFIKCRICKMENEIKK